MLLINSLILIWILIPNNLANILPNQTTSTENKDHQSNTRKKQNMKDILDHLLVGYDCSQPSEITSHEIESAEICQKKEANVQSQEMEVHILQKSNRIAIRAVSCSMRRTRISSYCGNAHHTTNIVMEMSISSVHRP